MSLVFHVAQKRLENVFEYQGQVVQLPKPVEQNYAGIFAGDLGFRPADEILLDWKLGLTECAGTWDVDFISIANHCAEKMGFGRSSHWIFSAGDVIVALDRAPGAGKPLISC